MSEGDSALTLSDVDQACLAEIEGLAAGGGAAIDALIARLAEPSWAVRRAVIAGLVHLGDLALEPLCQVLQAQRGDEARLAAAVDALAASPGDVESALLHLLDRRAERSSALLCDLAVILGRRKSASASAVLAELVGHGDDNVSVAAIEALGRIGGAGAVEPLIAAVESGRFFRVFPAIDVLGRSGDPRAVPALRALLDDPLCVLEAVRALGNAGEDRTLASVLTSTEDDQVRAAAVALTELSTRREERVGVDRATPAAVREVLLDPALAPRLRSVMVAADPAERSALCRLLGWGGGEAAVEALLALLDQGLQNTEVTAALANLGASAEPRIRRAVLEGDAARRVLLIPLLHGRITALRELRLCLTDPDPAVRAVSATALGTAGDPAVVPELFQLLGDEDAGVSQAASGAIQSLGSVRTEALALAAARSPNARVRRAALRIISYLGYPNGLDLLIDATHDGDPRIRDVGIQGLAFSDDPRSLEALLGAAAHPSPSARAAAMRALGHTAKGAPAVVACLQRGIVDPDAWVRYYACQAVGKVGGEIPVDAVVALLDDEAGQVRVAAIEALARLGTEGAVAALHHAAVSTDPDLARAALLGLGSLQRKDALPLIEQALRSSDRATRMVALGAASAIQAPEVLELLRDAAATDVDEDVRRAAIGHLAARSGPGATRTLISLLAEPRVRPDVIDALAQLGKGRRPALLSALETADDTIAPLLVRVLVRAADPVQALEAALASSEPPGRRAALAALAALAAPRCRPALERAFTHDHDPEVRRIAAVALGR